MVRGEKVRYRACGEVGECRGNQKKERRPKNTTGGGGLLVTKSSEDLLRKSSKRLEENANADIR